MTPSSRPLPSAIQVLYILSVPFPFHICLIFHSARNFYQKSIKNMRNESVPFYMSLQWSALSLADGSLTILLDGLQVISDFVGDSTDAVEGDFHRGDWLAGLVPSANLPVLETALVGFLLESVLLQLLQVAPSAKTRTNMISQSSSHTSRISFCCWRRSVHWTSCRCPTSDEQWCHRRERRKEESEEEEELASLCNCGGYNNGKICFDHW